LLMYSSQLKKSMWTTWIPSDRLNLLSPSSSRLHLDSIISWHLAQKLCVFGSTLYSQERKDITNSTTVFDKKSFYRSEPNLLSKIEFSRIRWKMRIAFLILDNFNEIVIWRSTSKVTVLTKNGIGIENR